MRDNKSGAERTDRSQEQRELPTLSDDRLYQALSVERRRRLLYVLLVEESSTVERLARVLAGWAATEGDGVVTAETHDRILTELDHVHLPVLDESGLVSYDREDGTVDIEPIDDTVAELISRSVESEPPSQP